ncbi:MAG TPA: YciI family protein [Gemmatimonadaceae bacterium]|nr:YciI family protein [Gemmatimonadaceae bacterium]
MTCEQACETLLDELLGSGERTASTPDHFESCPSCRSERRAMKELISRVRALQMAPPDPQVISAMRETLLAAARDTTGLGIETPPPGIHETARVRRTPRMNPRWTRFLAGGAAAAAGALITFAVMRSSPARARGAETTISTAMDTRPRFMLLLLDPAPSGLQSTAEEVRRVVAVHRAWADRLRSDGRLVLAEKLSDDPGRLLGSARASDTLAYTRSGDRLGGFYIIRADSYDDAKRVARTGPALPLGERIEIRLIEDN